MKIKTLHENPLATAIPEGTFYVSCRFPFVPYFKLSSCMSMPLSTEWTQFCFNGGRSAITGAPGRSKKDSHCRKREKYVL